MEIVSLLLALVEFVKAAAVVTDLGSAILGR
ncbi:Uncharacterised protein [Mycobacteroides abscessus subsp. abscessus]|nr:Uncharacterised protein [Mycobacteroides abscessus subsp. abscessus]